MRLVWTDLDNTEIRKMIDEGPDFTHEEWIGFGIALEKTCKPFPTCDTCDKYSTLKCPVTVEFTRVKEMAEGKDWRKKFHCADHSDFNPDNGGNNGKDM